MRECPGRPRVDEVLTTRIHGRRTLVHAREQRRDARGRVRIFLTGDPEALPHLGGMRIATRAGERFELRDVLLVPPPAEPGESPGPAQAALAVGYPVDEGRPPTRRDADAPHDRPAAPNGSPHNSLGSGP